MRINIGSFFKDIMPIESFKNGNYPKAVKDEAINQLTVGSNALRKEIALEQYRQDWMDEAFINNLMEADIQNLIDELKEVFSNAQCGHMQLLIMLIIPKLEHIKANKNFDLNNLLK